MVGDLWPLRTSPLANPKPGGFRFLARAARGLDRVCGKTSERTVFPEPGTRERTRPPWGLGAP